MLLYLIADGAAWGEYKKPVTAGGGGGGKERVVGKWEGKKRKKSGIHTGGRWC